MQQYLHPKNLLYNIFVYSQKNGRISYHKQNPIRN